MAFLIFCGRSTSVRRSFTGSSMNSRDVAPPAAAAGWSVLGLTSRGGQLLQVDSSCSRPLGLGGPTCLFSQLSSTISSSISGVALRRPPLPADGLLDSWRRPVSSAQLGSTAAAAAATRGSEQLYCWCWPEKLNLSNKLV